MKMIKNFSFLLLAIMMFGSCSDSDNQEIELPEIPDPSNTDFFFTGELNGEILDLHTASEDTLYTSRVGGRNLENDECIHDFFCKIHHYPLGPPNLEIGLMHFYNGLCDGQAELDAFDGLFNVGEYPFNVYSFSEPAFENSVSISFQVGTSDYYDSEQTDNTDSYFEITSSVDASDNFYKRRIIEGKISCNLKHTISGSVVRLENANFRILVFLEK